MPRIWLNIGFWVWTPVWCLQVLASGIFWTRHDFHWLLQHLLWRLLKNQRCWILLFFVLFFSQMCDMYMNVESTAQTRWKKKRRAVRKQKDTGFFFWDNGRNVLYLRYQYDAITMHACSHEHTQASLWREATNHQTAHPTDAWLNLFPLCLPGSVSLSLS